MKITLILIFVPLILSSTESSFYYEKHFESILKAVDFKDVYDKLVEAIDNIGNIVFDDEKKNVSQILGELILYFIELYKNNKEYLKKLENLKKKLNEYGFSNNFLINGGLSFLDKTISNILESNLDENYRLLAVQQYLSLHYFPILYSRLPSLHFPFITPQKFWKLLVKLQDNKIAAINKIKNRIKIFKYFKFAGNAISAIIRTKDKISKCKTNTTNVYFISSAQAVANVGTNMAFRSIGSFLGTFIPIPFIGTFAGGMVGNYIGEYINSLYDFDC